MVRSKEKDASRKREAKAKKGPTSPLVKARNAAQKKATRSTQSLPASPLVKARDAARKREARAKKKES